MPGDSPRPRRTRRRLLELLCSDPQTAAQLAAQLGISPNAVREMLGRMSEDGLVEHQVIRAGVGKPAHRYRLTDDGEGAVSRGYLPILRHLVAELREGSGASFQEVLRGTGARLASTMGSRPAGGTLAAAVRAAEALSRLGGAARATQENGSIRIESSCCAIAGLVQHQPSACQLVEAALTSYLGEPVRERCDRTGRPRCVFEIGA
jgi:predicted ArsR family transcriptional regulator